MSNNWKDVAAIDDLPDEDVTCIDIGGREVAFYRVANQVYATDNICTHGQARLCDGFLDGYEIECPLHQGRFDVRDGRVVRDPVTVDLRTYPVRVDQGRVLIAMD